MPIVIADMTAYDLKEISTLTGISLQTIRIYVKKGILKAVKVGNKIYVQEKDLKKIFEKGTCNPTRKKKGKKRTTLEASPKRKTRQPQNKEHRR